MNSFKKKYFYKLTTNIVSLLFNFITATFVPRQLGAVNYGNYSYIINVFTQIIAFLDFKSSTYFYVKLSQNKDDTKLVSFYFHYVLIVFLTLVLISGIFSLDYIKYYVFKEQHIISILFGMVFAFLLWLTDIATSFMDAIGETVTLERIKIYFKLFSLFSLSIVLVSQLLTLENYFLLQISSSLLVIFFIIYFVRKKDIFQIVTNRPSKTEFKEMFTKLIIYSTPLVGYMFLQMVSGFTDRWILQHYVGSQAQGLFSFSYSLTNVMSLFVSVLLPLIIREISIAAGVNDKLQIAKIYNQFYPLIFALVAYFTAFTFVQSSVIINLFGGKEYEESLFSFQLLLILPLLGVFSGLNGAIVYATHKTKLFFNIAIFATPLGLILNIILINPYFLALGHNGLVIKTVIVDFISLIIVLFILSKEYNISFSKIIVHFLFLIPFLTVAYVVSIASDLLGLKLIIGFIFSGLVYTMLLFVFLYIYPPIFGLNKNVRLIVNKYIKR